MGSILHDTYKKLCALAEIDNDIVKEFKNTSTMTLHETSINIRQLFIAQIKEKKRLVLAEFFTKRREAQKKFLTLIRIRRLEAQNLELDILKLEKLEIEYFAKRNIAQYFKIEKNLLKTIFEPWQVEKYLEIVHEIEATNFAIDAANEEWDDLARRIRLLDDEEVIEIWKEQEKRRNTSFLTKQKKHRF